MHKGQWFGEIALIKKTPRTATVEAASDTVLLYLSKERFASFLRIAPEVDNEYFKNLIQKVI